MFNSEKHFLDDLFKKNKEHIDALDKRIAALEGELRIMHSVISTLADHETDPNEAATLRRIVRDSKKTLEGGDS